MSKTKIYISGKITGLEKNEALKLFDDAKLKLLESFDIVINPIREVPVSPELDLEYYMLLAIKLLFQCKAIFMLKNWKCSKNARIEHAIAVELDLDIIYQ